MGSQRRINMLQVFPAVSCVHSGPRRSPRSPSVPHGPPWSPVVPSGLPSGPQRSPGHSEISTSWNIGEHTIPTFIRCELSSLHAISPVPSHPQPSPPSPPVPSRPQPSPAIPSSLVRQRCFRPSQLLCCCVPVRVGEVPLAKADALVWQVFHPLVRQINLEEKAVRAHDAAPADRL